MGPAADGDQVEDGSRAADVEPNYGHVVVRLGIGANAVALSLVLNVFGARFWGLQLKDLRESPNLVLAALWVGSALVSLAGYRWTFSRREDLPEPTMAKVLRFSATFCVGSGALVLMVVAVLSELASVWCGFALLMYTTIVLLTAPATYRLFVLSAVSFCSVAHLWIVLISGIAAAGRD